MQVGDITRVALEISLVVPNHQKVLIIKIKLLLRHQRHAVHQHKQNNCLQALEMAKGGFTAIKSALAAFLGLAFLAWILQIIGLAGLQRNCYDMNTLGQSSGLSTGGESVLASNLALTGIRGETAVVITARPDSSTLLLTPRQA